MDQSVTRERIEEKRKEKNIKSMKMYFRKEFTSKSNWNDNEYKMIKQSN